MRYFPWLLLAKFVLSLSIGYAIADVYPGRVDADKFLEPRRQMAALLVLPFMETLLLQLGVIETTRLLFGRSRERVGLWVGAFASFVVFFLLHYHMNGPFNGFAYGAVGGVAFAFMYAVQRKDGVKVAFTYTWMLHLASNALLLISFLFFSTVISG